MDPGLCPQVPFAPHQLHPRRGWMDIFRSSWRTGPSSGDPSDTWSKSPTGKEEIVGHPPWPATEDFGASLWAGALSELLMLLMGTSCYTSQRLGAGGVLSPQFHPAGVSSDQAGRLRSCSGCGCGSCRSIKSQASAGLNDSVV